MSERRSCGDCTVCCTHLAINDLPEPKPRGVTCLHAAAGPCAIYKDRPPSCQTFFCLWMLGWMPDSARPSRSGVFGYIEDDQTSVVLMEVKRRAFLQRWVQGVVQRFNAMGMAVKMASLDGRAILFKPGEKPIAGRVQWTTPPHYRKGKPP